MSTVRSVLTEIRWGVLRLRALTVHIFHRLDTVIEREWYHQAKRVVVVVVLFM